MLQPLFLHKKNMLDCNYIKNNFDTLFSIYQNGRYKVPFLSIMSWRFGASESILEQNE